jgi:CMP/dCMP kinase
VRAGRRFEEIGKSGGNLSYDDVLDDIRRRDARDMGRVDSPLRPADDAHLLDTSEMSIEAAFRAAQILIDEALARKKPS